ncbi:MAG: DUF2141 domain-containing protein [Alphaproteobacteria bacterium]|nr:DUF2141 domain-containing protein [Alphaproteobacteria bacterium]
MKFTTAIFGMLVLSPLAHAADLTVTIKNVQTQGGTIVLGLYDEAGFETDGALAGAHIAVDGDTVSTVFEGLAPGEYAIRLYHDVNDDGDMNTNPFGMPIEPYAFSNNARGRFGPPVWQAARFALAADGDTHTITLN